MHGKAAIIGLILMMFVFVSAYADGRNVYRVESAADKLYSLSSTQSHRLNNSTELDAKSCSAEDTAVITIYSKNGHAHSEIDVKVDGSPVGSLTTYFPDGSPGCKSPSARGVITLKVPAGKHTLEADSPNINWPSHNFSVNPCECMVLPLS